MREAGAPAIDRHARQAPQPPALLGDWGRAPEPPAGDLLERYLAHLGVDRPSGATIGSLGRLQRAHLLAIPFENLDALTERTLSLDAERLIDKLAGGDRGGYCFEHNLLFARALAALGYAVELLAGRVLIGQDVVRPSTHLALRVTIDGELWLVDVGFGLQAVGAPLRLDSTAVQSVPGHDVVLRPLAGQLVLHSRRHGPDRAWRPLYALGLDAVHEADVAMADHWVQTHPGSTMKQRIIVLRPTASGTRSLVGNRLAIDEDDRSVDRLIDPNELDDVLRREFGIAFPEPAALAAVWETRLQH